MEPSRTPADIPQSPKTILPEQAEFGNETPDDPEDETCRAGQPSSLSPRDLQKRLTHRLARLVLATFLFTFLIARILVIYIMAGKLPPQLFFHVSGTHIHHLNYGIFLLSASGAYLLFVRPQCGRLTLAAIVYAIGLGLTFDEFGMWLHLGGPYWQRASFDAVVTVAAILALIAYGSTLRRWKPKHRITIGLLAVVLVIFGIVLTDSLRWADQRIGPALYHLEERGPQ